MEAPDWLTRGLQAPLDALVRDSTRADELAFGDTLVQHGDTLDQAWVVVHGQVRLATVAGDGTEQTVARVGPDAWFGAGGRTPPGTRSPVTARAMEPTRVLRIDAGLLAALKNRGATAVAQHEVPLPTADPAATYPTPPSDPGGPVEPPPQLQGRRGLRPGRGFPMIRQADGTDCGPATLAMVLTWFGGRPRLSRLRDALGSGKDGTGLDDLVRVARRCGVPARGVRVSEANLDRIPLPAIVHLEGLHWAVLVEVRDTGVRLADPLKGFVDLEQSTFLQQWSGFSVLFEVPVQLDLGDLGGRPIGPAWLARFLGPYRAVALEVLGLAVLASVLELAVPIFTRVVVDRVLVDRDVVLLHWAFALFCLAIAGMLAAQLVQRYLTAWVTVRVDAAAVDHLVERLLDLPLRWFQRRTTGDVQRRLQGVPHLRTFFFQHGVQGLTATTSLLAAVGLMWWYAPRIALAYSVVLAVGASGLIAAARWMRPVFDDLEVQWGRYFAEQVDTLEGIEDVKALAAEGERRTTLWNRHVRTARTRFRADLLVLAYEVVIQLLAVGTLGLTLMLGAHEVLAGRLSLGALVAFVTLVGLANQPLTTLLVLWDDLQLALVLLNRLDDVLAQPAVDPGSRLTVELVGHLRFEGASFRYREDGENVVSDVWLEVRPGETVAIVGRSGAGKSTLLRMAAGLLEPTEGQVTWDGVPTRRLDGPALRRQLGVVLQEARVFEGTVLENIAWGTGDPDPVRARAALREVGLEAAVDALPLRGATRIGASGVRLSGGERQRLVLARALYRSPVALLLDEPTSALDGESERAVQESLERGAPERATLIVAHRASSLRAADRIVVVDHGTVVESGTHEELWARDGLYVHLYREQLGR